MPLDDGYSFDFEQDKSQNIRNGLPQSGSTSLIHADIPAEWKESTGKVWEKLNPIQKKVLDYVEEHGKITNKEVQKLLGVKESRALKILKELTAMELLRKEGVSKGAYYVIS